MRGYTHGYTNTNLRGKYKVVSRGVTVAAAPRSRPVKACQGMLAPPQKRPPVLTADSRKPKASIVFVPMCKASLVTGGCVIRETTQTGRPWSRPRVSLSISLSIYLSVYLSISPQLVTEQRLGLGLGLG